MIDLNKLKLKETFNLSDVLLLMECLKNSDGIYWDDLFDTCRWGKRIDDGVLSVLFDVISEPNGDASVKSYCVEMIGLAPHSENEARFVVEHFVHLVEGREIRGTLWEQIVERMSYVASDIGYDIRCVLLNVLKRQKCSFGFRCWILYRLIAVWTKNLITRPK